MEKEPRRRRRKRDIGMVEEWNRRIWDIGEVEDEWRRRIRAIGGVEEGRSSGGGGRALAMWRKRLEAGAAAAVAGAEASVMAFLLVRSGELLESVIAFC